MSHGRTEMLAFLGVLAAALAVNAQQAPTVDATATRTTMPTTAKSFRGDLSFSAFPAAEKAEVAYLGVSTSQPQTALQKQLQLKAGVGLVVDSVAPDSPAGKAGVQQYDILHKLDDQLLINAEQLDVLVRSLGAGKDVKLAVIREGKPIDLDAKIESRMLETTRFSRRPTTSQSSPYSYYRPARQRTPIAYFNDQSDVIRIKDPKSQAQLSAAQIMIDDGRRKMTISTRDHQRQLKAEDKAGKLLFEGPIHTNEQLEKVPAELRAVLKEILFVDAVPTSESTTKPTTLQAEPTTQNVVR